MSSIPIFAALCFALAEAAQPVHREVTSEGVALLRSEKLQPKPRLPSCAGSRLQCSPPNSLADVDPCKGTDCKGHHACMGLGFQNCMIKVMGPGREEPLLDLF